MTDTELRELCRSLSEREQQAVLGLLSKYARSAEKSAARLVALRTRDNAEQIDRHIRYWNNIKGGFEWVIKIGWQQMNPGKASNGTADTPGIQQSSPTDSKRRKASGRKVRTRSAPL